MPMNDNNSNILCKHTIHIFNKFQFYACSRKSSSFCMSTLKMKYYISLYVYISYYLLCLTLNDGSYMCVCGSFSQFTAKDIELKIFCLFGNVIIF